MQLHHLLANIQDKTQYWGGTSWSPQAKSCQIPCIAMLGIVRGVKGHKLFPPASRTTRTATSLCRRANGMSMGCAFRSSSPPSATQNYRSPCHHLLLSGQVLQATPHMHTNTPPLPPTHTPQHGNQHNETTHPQSNIPIVMSTSQQLQPSGLHVPRPMHSLQLAGLKPPVWADALRHRVPS